MATYNDLRYVQKSADPAFFGPLRPPGARAPHSGIYRCTGCGLEEVSKVDDALPPEDAHRHRPDQGPIKWQLIVRAEHLADQGHPPS